jgi:hypothetical protein
LLANKWSSLLFTTYSLSLSFLEAVVISAVARSFRSFTVLADLEGYRSSLADAGDEPHYPRPARRVGGTFPGARGACRGRVRSGADFGELSDRRGSQRLRKYAAPALSLPRAQCDERIEYHPVDLQAFVECALARAKCPLGRNADVIDAGPPWRGLNTLDQLRHLPLECIG